MRPQDVYEYVAVRDIMAGNVCAFRAGDPVPGSTVDEQGYGKEDVALAADYRPSASTDMPLPAPRRGEMPPHLAAKAVPEHKPTKATPGKE